MKFSYVTLQVANRDQLTWPFRCEPAAWASWQCVCDIAVSIPAKLFSAFRTSCLGYSACHPDALEQGGGLVPKRFDRAGGYPQDRGYAIGGGYSGHGCYRCVMQHTERIAKGEGGEAARRGTPGSGGGTDEGGRETIPLSLPTGFAWHVEQSANPRSEEGRNPYYNLASEHDFMEYNKRWKGKEKGRQT